MLTPDAVAVLKDIDALMALYDEAPKVLPEDVPVLAQWFNDLCARAGRIGMGTFRPILTQGAVR